MTDGQVLLDHMREEHQLLARAVLLDGDDAQQAFDAWRAMVDIDLIDGASQRLLPLVARRLPDFAPDDPLRGRIKGIFRYSWVQRQGRWHAATSVIDAFEAAGIHTAVLKGSAMSDAYGPDWGARPMYDVDVLVPVADAARAVDLLDALGWEPEFGQSAAWVRTRGVPRRHSWGFVNGDGRVDLHWHVLVESIGARSDRGFWERARPVEIAGMRTRVLDPADMLMHVLVHGTVGDNAPQIQWVIDAVMVLRHERDDATFPARVAATTHEQGEQRSVARALDAIGLLVGREVVADVLDAVEARRPSVVERLRGPRVPVPVQQVARNAAGGEGFPRAVLELSAQRIDLDFATNRVAALTYLASARSPRVASFWRERAGSFVRTSVDDVPAITDGAELDFAESVVLDRYGANGWSRVYDDGADLRGGEARLVLPLAPELRGRDLDLALQLGPRAGAMDVVVLANEVEVARARVETDGSPVRARVPAAVADRFHILELAIRPAKRFPPPPLRLRLRSLRIAASG